MSVAQTLYVGATIRNPPSFEAAGDAILVGGGRIIAMGPVAAVRARGTPSTEVIDVTGLTIMPGLIDAHCHLSTIAYLLGAARCGPAEVEDIPSLVALVGSTEPRADGWVTGGGLQEYRLREGRYPTRWELDAAVPSLPCVVYQTSLHSCVVNSAGLVRLGLADDTTDPPGGRLQRDDQGRPTGVLFERPMFDLLAANQRALFEGHVPRERDELVAAAAHHLASYGITACTEAGVDRATFSVYEHAASVGAMPIRVRMLLATDDPSWPEDTLAVRLPGRLTAGGVKLFADGGMTSRTAALDEPYETRGDGRGMLLLSPEELDEQVDRYSRQGLQVAVHAQGERAIRGVITALSKVAGSDNPLRHRIEHGGAFAPALRQAAQTSRIAVASQPGFIPVLGDEFRRSLGRRVSYLYPFRSLLSDGIVVAGSSDAPVIDADPRVGLFGATQRLTSAGHPFALAEAVPTHDALRMYTEYGAFVSHLDDRIGDLRPGMDADFVAFAGDPLDPPGGDHRALRAVLTVVRGNVVFGISGAGASPP